MTAPSTQVGIVVADDHQVVREGFAELLNTQSDFTVLGTARDGAEAVQVCRALHPDVVLMDVRMPVMDGIEATRQLTSPNGGRPPRILILTTFDLANTSTTPCAPAVTRRLLSEFARQHRTPDTPRSAALATLTHRETQVLQAVVTAYETGLVIPRTRAEA